MYTFIALLLLQMALKPGVGLGLRYNMPPGFSVPCSLSLSLSLSLHSFIPIFLRSTDTSSSHLILGRPLRLVAYSFPHSILFGISVSCILSTCPNHRILWHLINLTMFSHLIMASNSSFCRVLHNSFSFTGPYIFSKTFATLRVIPNNCLRLVYNIKTILWQVFFLNCSHVRKKYDCQISL